MCFKGFEPGDLKNWIQLSVKKKKKKSAVKYPSSQEAGKP